MIPRRSIHQTALLGILAVALGACDSTGPAGPKGPGTLTATLVSPNGAEGSAVFEITGGIDLGFVITTGGEVFHQHSGGTSRVVVILDDPGEIRFRVGTEDVAEIPQVAVIQVADGENHLRPSLSGYEVRVEGENSFPGPEQESRP
jgi:hypothetical protein